MITSKAEFKHREMNNSICDKNKTVDYDFNNSFTKSKILDKNYSTNKNSPKFSIKKMETKSKTNVILAKKIEKENDELKKMKDNYDILIKKLEKANDSLEQKTYFLNEENEKIRNQIEIIQDTNEQLTIIINLIKNSGVDFEGIINREKINNNFQDNINEKKEQENISLTNNDENNFDSEINSDSFLPLFLDGDETNNKNRHRSTYSFSYIPKLDFEKFKNGI